MSSTSLTIDVKEALSRADRLKRELTEFATAGPLKEEYLRQQQLLSEVSAIADEQESESMLDWFLYEWIDEKGKGVIDQFKASREDFSEVDQQILLDWIDSINSVFEIRSLGKKSLRLREMDSGDVFTVHTVNPLEEMPFKRGQFIAARLLPLGDDFIFANSQFIMPDRESAMEALEVRRALEDLASPEALEQAQREQCTSFCEFFGCDELTVPLSELNPTLERFQHYVFFEKRDGESNMTMAERFESEFGCELKFLTPPPIPDQIAEAGEVTVLCDEFDGIVLLPDYNKFKRVLEAANPDEIAGWQELMWDYIKNPDIPIVAFERVAEQNPSGIERVFRKLLGEKSFSIEHLYAVLLHYKEPVEGLENLEDDERLWDLFDGHARQGQKTATSKAKPKKSSGKSKASVAGKRQPAKKQAASKKAGTAKASAKVKSSARGKAVAGKKAAARKR